MGKSKTSRVRMSKRLDQILQDLETLSIDAPEWGDLSEFLPKLQLILEARGQKLEEYKKEQAAINVQRVLLHEQLEKLQKLPNNMLEYGDIMRCGQWRIELVSNDQFEDVNEALILLRELLVEYDNIERREVHTRSQRKALRSKLDVIDKQFDLNVQYLDKIFSEVKEAKIEEGLGESGEQATSGDIEDEILIKDEELDSIIKEVQFDIGEETTISVAANEKVDEEQGIPSIEDRSDLQEVDREEEVVETEAEIAKIPSTAGGSELTGESVEEGKHGEVLQQVAGGDGFSETEGEEAAKAGTERKITKSEAIEVLVEMASEEEAVDDLAAEKMELDSAPSEESDVESETDLSLTEEKWIEFFWQLVGDGDLSAAYWVARSLANQSKPIAMPVPDWLVAAVQGAWWINSVSGELIQDMMQLAYAQAVGDSADEKLMAVCAGLLPALKAPSTGLGSWLTPDPLLPESFNEVIEAVREFSNLGHVLRRDVILAVRGEDLRMQKILRLQEDAQRWVKEAPMRRTYFKRATDVWRTWTKSGGLLRNMVDIVAKGVPDRNRELRQLIKEWRGKSNLDWLRQTDIEIRGFRPAMKSHEIDGSVRDKLLNQAEETLELAEEWLDLVGSPNEQTDWFLAQIETLVHRVENVAVRAANELTQMEARTSNTPSPSVIRLLRWSLQDVCRFLGLADFVPVSLKRTSLNFPHGVVEGLRTGLQYRLFFVPEVGLRDDADNAPARLEETASILYRSKKSDRSLSDAFNLHLNLADYRFTGTMIQNLSEDQPIDYERRLQEAEISSKNYLENQLREISDAIELSVIDGLLDETTRAELADKLESIRSARNKNFGSLERLLKQIREILDTVRLTRLEQQKERWDNLMQRLQEFGFNETEPELFATIVNFLEDVMTRGDIVVVDERLSRLEELLDRGELPQKEEFLVQPKRDQYIDFVSTLNQWESRSHRNSIRNYNMGHLVNDLKHGSRPAVLSVGSLPTPQLKEVSDTFNRWHQLKRMGDISRRDLVQRHIRNILRYLGFTFKSSKGTGSIKWIRNDKDWAYVSADMTAANLSPIPQFGSQHPEPFDVICFWERPRSEKIASRIHNLKLNTNNVIVFFLGRLTKKPRNELMKHMRQENLSLVVLDEYLLLYLAREDDARLPIFLKCALPLTKTNPYVETGPVASEMFKGRVHEKAELQNRLGYSLVSGGRQLGKSALLQQVEREFHNPEADRFVIREDIKPIGDPLSQQADPDLIWLRLKAGLDKFDLLPKTVASKPDTIINQIKTMMGKNPNRRILLLFDEADNFLAADEERNFEIVSDIKRLMDSTDRRFKAIFAGLHNVQRYEGVPNQPFAHLRGLQVGPLEPKSAKQLIVDPLEALGFRFPEGDVSPILGILAYTNSHPGLIQLFCQKLLERMYAQRPNNVGPYEISRNDVEAVYRQREVQEGIKRRFEWTLALDPRYKALAEIMVFEQLQDRDSYARTFSVPEMRDFSRKYWSKAFEGSNLDEFRGYLDEMVGLGVLVRNENNAYRLRSPNLVRLMGSEDDIFLSLQELTSKTISPTFSPDSHHAPLDSQANRYSPFTFAQSRWLNAERHGVGLIFGSQALGLDDVENAIKTHFVLEGSAGKCRRINLAANTGAALFKWLEKFQRDHGDDAEQLIAYRILRGGITQQAMAAQVEAAVKFSRRHRNRKRLWMRVFLIFDCVRTFDWLQLAFEERTRLEGQADIVVTLRRWDEIGIEQRLQQHNKMAADRTIRQIMRELGGWPYLLDKMADQWDRKGDDPLPSSRKLSQDILDSELGHQFLSATGWKVDPRVTQVLQTIVHYESMATEDLVPGVLDESLTTQECELIAEYLSRMGLVYELVIDEKAQVFPDTIIKRLVLVS